MTQYEVGNIVKGEVTGIEEYGVFVRLENDYSGLIHISEVASNYVRDINEYVKVGEHIYVHILKIDENTKQMKLSIKNINYKENGMTQTIHESLSGFLPLHDNLDRWTKEKLSEIEK